MVARLRISANTAGRGLRELAEIGIIYQVPGHGYFPNIEGGEMTVDSGLADGCAAREKIDQKVISSYYGSDRMTPRRFQREFPRPG